MKKILVVALAGAITVSLVACSEDNDISTQDDSTLEQQEEELSEEDDLEQLDIVETEPEKNDSGLDEINIGEQVEVNTEYGDFLLTVDNVRKCDWIERAGRESDKYVAVLLECDIDNISYDNPQDAFFMLKDLMTVTDDEGYVVNNLGYSYDDGLYAEYVEIPEGSKGRVLVAYNCGIDVQSITVNINEQYVLEAQVEEANDADKTEVTVETEETETTDLEPYDNRDFSSVIERMASLPTNGHFDLSELVEVELDDQTYSGYNIRFTSDDVNASTFQVLCNPEDKDGLITLVLLPQTLNGDTGNTDYSYVITYLIMAVDDSLSMNEAADLALKAIDDESVTKNDITYTYSTSAMFFGISY